MAAGYQCSRRRLLGRGALDVRGPASSSPSFRIHDRRHRRHLRSRQTNWPRLGSLIGRFFPDSQDLFVLFFDFLGRLQPSKTTIQKTLNTLGVEESSYPRKVLHFYSSNSWSYWELLGITKNSKEFLGIASSCLGEASWSDGIVHLYYRATSSVSS